MNKGRKFSPLCILIDNIPKPKRKIELIQWHIEQEVHYFPKARFHLLRKRLNPWYDCFQSNVLFADHETWIRNPIHRNSNSNRIWLAMATDFDMTSLLCRLRLLSAWKGNPALSEKKNWQSPSRWSCFIRSRDESRGGSWLSLIVTQL